MNKKILTLEEVLKNVTYDVTNICYKDNIKPIFKVTEEGFRYKAFQLANDYSIVESSCDDITTLKDTNLFVETNEGFVMVDAKILHKLLMYLSK